MPQLTLTVCAVCYMYHNSSLSLSATYYWQFIAATIQLYIFAKSHMLIQTFYCKLLRTLIVSQLYHFVWSCDCVSKHNIQFQWTFMDMSQYMCVTINKLFKRYKPLCIMWITCNCNCKYCWNFAHNIPWVKIWSISNPVPFMSSQAPYHETTMLLTMYVCSYASVSTATIA